MWGKLTLALEPQSVIRRPAPLLHMAPIWPRPDSGGLVLRWKHQYERYLVTPDGKSSQSPLYHTVALFFSAKQSGIAMAKQQFGQLRAAAIDGRTQTIYYRQAQLEKLYETLVENATSIQEVIVTDTGVSQAEARIEYSLALSSLREQYAQLDPLKEHEEEYLIREGRNAPSLRTGVGIVYIKPTTHTLFFSVISPLSAAIAAGNCVLLQVMRHCPH